MSEDLRKRQRPSRTALDLSRFSIGTTTHCILVSPLFWTSVIIGLALLILFIVGVFHLIPGCVQRTMFVKHIFRRVDLVGEGEMWIGGLVSIAILVLLSFAYYFSSSYAQLYPIETSGEVQFACDPQMRNAKFSSSLQLLSRPKSEDEEPLFRLLDEQQFTMTIDFVQTLFDCDQVTVQQNIGTNHILLDIGTCERYQTNATLSVSLIVPQHLATIQVNLTGTHLTCCIMNDDYDWFRCRCTFDRWCTHLSARFQFLIE